MLRLSRLINSSICCLLLLNFAWLLTTTPGALAKPTTASSGNGSTHIVSFVKDRRGQARMHEEFDFERNEAESISSVHVQQLFGSLLKLQGPAGNNSLDTDDAPANERNTLDDEFGPDEPAGEQHESSTEQPDAWHRIKLAIPVLEPLKHLINAVGGGGVNDTHVRTNSHRLIGHSGVHHATHPHSNNSSPAIETEEDREEAIDSTGFNVLERLGTTGTTLWNALQYIRSLFAASAANASAAFSGGGGGGGGGGDGGGDGGGGGAAAVDAK